ncbi:MAG: hypothetical protein ACK5V3_16700 [Bdellovibrionales bacterium]
MINFKELSLKMPWLESGDIRPYVFVRPENAIKNPGARHKCDWFPFEPVTKDPLDLKEIHFADRIYAIEERAFGPSNMAMPRWVFYDCAVMPGFVAGFAARPQALTPSQREALDPMKVKATGSPLEKTHLLPAINSIDDMDWVPLSLFIIIPTMHKGEWVAHNLCSVNSLLKKEDQLYGLGFMSKAFGLWYANVEQCSGMTQWGSPALKLHSHYGWLEVIGAYAPVHSHRQTVTYRADVHVDLWSHFFTKEEDMTFLENFGQTQYEIDPQNEPSMVKLQELIEGDGGPFYLSAHEIAKKSLSDKLTVYQPKSTMKED